LGGPNLDLAVVTIDDPFHQAETEPGTLTHRRPRRIGSIEPLENMRNGRCWDADARVGHIDSGVIAFT
jgi:hypothetical protein